MDKNAAKQKLVSTKNKIAKNQTKIMGTALVVTTAAAAIMIRAKVISDQFLKEKGLYDEFYTPDAADIEN
jgi:hypothetical protein